MRLILHIGTPKTGTTHLQASLAKGDNRLQERGYLYPESGRRFGKRLDLRHSGLRIASEAFDKAPNGMMKILGLEDAGDREAYFSKFWEDLEREIESSGNIHTAIMSDEALFAFGNRTMVQNMSREASKIFSEIEVIATFRRPSEYLSSGYSQSVKMGRSDSWDEYMDKYLSKAPEKTLFERFFAVWRKFMNYDRFVVRPASNDILSQFSDMAKIGFNLENVDVGKNKSLTPTGIQVLRKINEIASSDGTPYVIRETFDEMASGEKWKAPSSDMARIDKTYKDEILRISDSFGISGVDMETITSWFHPAPTPEMQKQGLLSDADAAEVANVILKLARSK